VATIFFKRKNWGAKVQKQFDAFDALESEAASAASVGSKEEFDDTFTFFTFDDDESLGASVRHNPYFKFVAGGNSNL